MQPSRPRSPRRSPTDCPTRRPEHLRGELRADRPVEHSYRVEARGEEFVRLRHGGAERVWRRNEIWRRLVDRRTGELVGEELLKRNCAVVKYLPPEHLVVDLDQDGRALVRPQATTAPLSTTRAGDLSTVTS
jgi:vancomycin resistance protein VanW